MNLNCISATKLATAAPAPATAPTFTPIPKFSLSGYLCLAFTSATLLLSGCSTTPNNANASSERNRFIASENVIAPAIDRIEMTCHSAVLQRENSVGLSAGAAQQIALAKAATRCFENKIFYPQHPDNQTAMQLNALAVVNFIKAGESEMAEHSLDNFRRQFPQQDLLFADYTSFVDTAIALLEYNDLSAHQLQTLNINRALRNELKRQQYWLRN